MGGDRLAAEYLWFGLSASTRSSYNSVVDGFITFCKRRGVTGRYLPARADVVEAWIADEARRLAVKGLAKGTLTRRMGALASWHVDMGMDKSGLVNSRVQRVIAGAYRAHGIKAKPQALPITLPVLENLVRRIRSAPNGYGGPRGHVALIALFCLMFGCFLRMGESTWTEFDGRYDLSRRSITDSQGVMRIKIPVSKTDPFRQGTTLVVPSGQGASLCPRTELRAWLALLPSADPSAPLFEINGSFGRPMVIRYLTKALSDCGYVSSAFTGHSFRRGAATWASSIGMASSDIQTLGRWASDCYKLYIDIGHTKVSEMGVSLMSTPAARSSLPANGLPAPGDVWQPAL